MAKKKEVDSGGNEYYSLRGLFIFGGALFGLGFGFLFDEILVGLFIGLGLGLLIYLILRLRK